MACCCKNADLTQRGRVMPTAQLIDRVAVLRGECRLILPDLEVLGANLMSEQTFDGVRCGGVCHWVEAGRRAYSDT